MNKLIYTAIGAVTGAAVGVIIVWFKRKSTPTVTLADNNKLLKEATAALNKAAAENAKLQEQLLVEILSNKNRAPAHNMQSLSEVLGRPQIVRENPTGLVGSTGYIDQLKADEVAGNLLVGKDEHGRDYVSFMYEIYEGQGPDVITAFKRYQSKDLWICCKLNITCEGAAAMEQALIERVKKLPE